MAEGGAPETPTGQASQLIFGAENLQYQIEQFIQSGGQAVKILLSGKTGVGKSHLTNALLGEELAEEGDDLDPETDKVTPYDFIKNNVNITVFDTPGLADATGKDEEYLWKIKENVTDFDLFLFCTEMNTRRFRSDDLETMKKLTMTFGRRLWDHAVVVFTFANEVPVSPTKKTKESPEKNIFNDRFLGFKKKIKQALIELEVPEEAVIKVPFVPAGDSDEPRLPDRDNWLTALWAVAFKRINRNAKAAFLLANVDRIEFSSDFPSDGENRESDYNAGSPCAGLSAEEANAIKELKEKLQQVSFEKTLGSCLLKPRPYDEAGNKSGKSQNQLVKPGPSIVVDETSSHDIINEMIGDATGRFVGELTTTTFGRYYQAFFSVLVKYLRRVFLPSAPAPALEEKPEEAREEAEEENEPNEDNGDKKECETEVEKQLSE